MMSYSIGAFAQAGAVMLAILPVLLLLYYCFLIKQRGDLQLQLRQAQIDKQNELLKTLAHEKEWLLKEVHHRVKNNLQIVISLLNTQSAYLDNEDAILAIRNSQNRVYAMSLVHLRLYKSGNMSSIDMTWYIQELVEYTRQSFALEEHIDFVTDIDKIELDIVQAIPVALILNEAIGNAVKHAFADSNNGIITISMKQLNDDACALTVADNGCGFPAGFHVETNHSLGINLMRGLTTQLDGSLAFDSHKGLTVRINFMVNTRTYSSELQTLQGE